MIRNQGLRQRLASRRSWLRLAAAGASIGPLFKLAEKPIGAQTKPPESVNKFSSPSDLKITDMRYCFVDATYVFPIIRIDTNQGVYGLSEVFSQGVPGQALILKPYLVGKNPLDIEAVLAPIRRFAGQQYMGSGYGAVDIALHDIAGKVYGVPAWRLIGNKVRDRVRLYCDTDGSEDPKIYAQRMLERKKRGFTFFKMDLYTRLVAKRPGAVNQSGAATDKGLQYLCEYIAAVRDAIGWDAPLGADHFGRLSVNDAIRYCKAFEPYQLAWAEDLVTPFTDWRKYKTISDATSTPILTGESNFGLEEGFKELLDNRAVDLIHPDEVASGGLLEVKRIADYAAANGIPTAIHMAGCPIGQMAAVHMAATMTNFVACETHNVEDPWWQDLVTGPKKPLIQDGYIPVPDTPGLGVELNEEVVKQHLREPGYFEPTPMFDKPMVGLVRRAGRVF